MKKTKKIKKILMANRGEIASRVIRTCQKLGIEVVTIHSDIDQNLAYTKEGIKSCSLGGGSLSETYLDQEKILEIALRENCDGVHPGYGFLSENAEFAQRVLEKGLIFIGPSPENIKLMGDKKTSKKILEKEGIPLIPGYHGERQDEAFLLKEAEKIGFPVLIKASAGGGGKGMKIVQNKGDFSTSLKAAQNEAEKAFGNPQVLIEKYIKSPRHIEVQLIGDIEGNVFHLFERECSIQRRYQKIIEESPAPFLEKELKSKIFKAAVKIGEALKYQTVGTVEFILAPSGEFYFLEMNTRLQVEHPVTEMVTGQDLVELQIRLAQGERLGISQNDLEQIGHSVECRLYGENPDEDFMPSTGVIKKMGVLPKEVRWDGTYGPGDEVSIFYDPMMGKLISYAEDRDKAIFSMERALEEFYILGLQTNASFLRRVLSSEEFKEGRIDTHFINRFREKLIRRTLSPKELAMGMAVMEFQKGRLPKTPWKNPWETLKNWRLHS